MYFGFNTASGKYYCNGLFILASGNNKIAKGSFNTASGKYYCNLDMKEFFNIKSAGFNTASGKYYCNGGFAMNTAFLPM